MEQIKITKTHIFPPNSANVRGQATSLDAHLQTKRLVYGVSNVIVVRSLDALHECSIFEQHKAETTAVRISANGQFCASGDAFGNVFIWELNVEGHPVFRTFENYLGGAVKDISWTADGQRLVIGGEGKTFFAKAVLVESGSSIGDLIGVSHRVLCCDLRPVRPFRIALGGEDQFVAFYEGPPFKFSKSSKLHSNYVTCLRYNHTGELLVSGSTDKKLFVYNGKDLSQIGEIKSDNPHQKSINSLSWIDDTTFATSSNDGTVKLWDTKETEESLIKTLRICEHPNQVNEQQVAVVAVSGDIYSISQYGILNLWKDVKSLPEGSYPTHRFHGHNASVGYMLQDSVDGVLYTGDFAGKILIWDQDNATLPEGQGLSQTILGLAITQDRSQLIALGGQELASVDLQTKKFQQVVECKGQTIGLSLSGDECYVLLESGHLNVFKNSTLEYVREIALTYEVGAFALSRCGKWLFIGDKKGNVHVLNSQTGAQEHQLLMGGNRITVVTVSKVEGKNWVLAGDSTGKIKLWDYETKEELFGEKWVYHTTIITSLSLSPSLNTVLSTSQDNKLMLWSTVSGARLAEKMDIHKKGAFMGLITNDKKIITSGGDNTIKVWSSNIDLS